MARIRALLAVGTLIAASTFTPAAAGAAGTHRALVIVDTGTAAIQRVVTFDADSITGMQALALAGANPVVYTYAGQGGAVCRLFGVGRDAGPNCLGGGDGDNRYWAYFRAASGTSSFTYSRGGAGSTAVHNGDVEGWKFGTGAAPAWSAVPPPATTTTTTTTSAPVATPGNGPGSSSGPSASGAPPASATPEQIAAYWAAVNGGSTTTTPSTTAPPTQVRGASTRREAGGSGRVAASRGALPADSVRGSGGGTTGWGSIAGFALAAAAIVGIGLYLRRLRARPIP